VIYPANIGAAALREDKHMSNFVEDQSAYMYKHGKGILNKDENLLTEKQLKFILEKQTCTIEKALITLCERAIEPNGKPIVFFLGPTGSGKSSLIGFLQGCDYTYDYGEDKAENIENSMPPGLEIPQVGHEHGESKTKGSNIYVQNNEVSTFSFCDSEGFLGTAAGRSIPELYIALYDPYFVIQANRVHGIVLVFDDNTMGAQRGLMLDDIIKCICKHFFQVKLCDLKKSFLIAVMKMGSYHEQRKFLGQLKKVIKGVNEEFYSAQNPDKITQKRKIFFELLLEAPVHKEDVQDSSKFIIDKSMIVFPNNCGMPILSSALDIDNKCKIKAINQKLEEECRSDSRDFLLAKISRFTGIPASAFSRYDAGLLEGQIYKIAEHLDKTLLAEGRKEYYRYKMLKTVTDYKLNQDIIQIIKADQAYLLSKISAYNEPVSIFFENYRKINPYESYSIIEATGKDISKTFSVIKNDETDDAINGVALSTGAVGTVLAVAEVGPAAPVVGGIARGTAYGALKGTQYTVASSIALISGAFSFFARGLDYLYNGYLIKTFEYEGEELISEIKCGCTNGYFSIMVDNDEKLKMTKKKLKFKLKSKLH